MLEFLGVPFYIWIIIIAVIAFPLILILQVLRGGWRWKVLHFFKDGSFELFPCKREEGKIMYRPYRGGFKKGEPVEKVIVTEAATMIHSPVAYRVYITNDDCPTTIPPPREIVMTKVDVDLKCPKCKEKFKQKVEVPNPKSQPDYKPAIISLSQTRGILSALRAVSERIKRGPWLTYVIIGLLCFALGAMVNFFVMVSTGHYKLIIGGLLSLA